MFAGELTWEIVVIAKFYLSTFYGIIQFARKKYLQPT